MARMVGVVIDIMQQKDLLVGDQLNKTPACKDEVEANEGKN